MKRNYTLKKGLVVFVIFFLATNGILAQSYDIHVFDVKAGTTKRITKILNGDEFNVTWSGDGKKIAHDVVGAAAAPFDQTIYVTDIRSGSSTQLVGAEGGNDAAWSPGEEDEHDDE